MWGGIVAAVMLSVFLAESMATALRESRPVTLVLLVLLSLSAVLYPVAREGTAGSLPRRRSGKAERALLLTIAMNAICLPAGRSRKVEPGKASRTNRERGHS